MSGMTGQVSPAGFGATMSARADADRSPRAAFRMQADAAREDSFTAEVARARQAAPRQFGRFADVLERHARTAEADARKPARELVAETFVRPILAQIRENNNAAPPFAPGAIEKRFGPLIDETLADRIVSGANMPIVDAVAREIVRRATGVDS